MYQFFHIEIHVEPVFYSSFLFRCGNWKLQEGEGKHIINGAKLPNFAGDESDLRRDPCWVKHSKKTIIQLNTRFFLITKFDINKITFIYFVINRNRTFFSSLYFINKYKKWEIKPKHKSFGLDVWASAIII